MLGDNMVGNTGLYDELPGLDDLEDTSVDVVRPKTKPKSKPKSKAKPKAKSSTLNLPSPPISPKSAFDALPVRKSPRFSPQNTVVIEPTVKGSTNSDKSLFARKIPKITARRKGLCLNSHNVGMSTTIGSETATEKCEIYIHL